MNVLLRLRGHKDKTVPINLAGNSVTVVDLESIESVAPTVRPRSTASASRKKPGRARKPSRTKEDTEEEWLVH